MPRSASRDGDAGGEEERVRRPTETLPRVLYWWRVPESPGVGKHMLVFVGLWFATLVALLVIIGVIVAVAG